MVEPRHKRTGGCQADHEEYQPGNGYCSQLRGSHVTAAEALSQLVVPVTVSSWKGTAILDTGSSYTLINGTLWKELKGCDALLLPWLQGPLYLADGRGRYSTGWSELPLKIQQQVTNVPVVVLPTSCLALPVVLGLDFVSISGLQFDVSEKKTYWFKSSMKRRYHFLRQQKASLDKVPPQVLYYSAAPPITSLSSRCLVCRH